MLKCDPNLPSAISSSPQTFPHFAFQYFLSPISLLTFDILQYKPNLVLKQVSAIPSTSFSHKHQLEKQNVKSRRKKRRKTVMKMIIYRYRSMFSQSDAHKIFIRSIESSFSLHYVIHPHCWCTCLMNAINFDAVDKES